MPLKQGRNCVKMRSRKGTVKSYWRLRNPAHKSYYVELRNKIAEFFWYVKKGG